MFDKLVFCCIRVQCIEWDEMCQTYWKLLLKGNKEGGGKPANATEKDDAGLIHSMLIPNAFPSFFSS